MSFVVALALAGTAEASTWEYVGSAANGSVYYIDKDSVTRDSNKARAWFKIDYRAVKTEQAREEKQLDIFNCAEKTSNLLAYTSYRANGTVLKSENWSDNSYEYRPIVPDSIGEFMWTAACQ